MTQNEKDIFLKDLCARLPYRPKIWFAESNSNDNLQNIWYDDLEGWQVDGDNLSAPVYAVKPYLYPLSSMTKEQKEEFNSYFASVPYYGDNEQEHVVPYYFVELLMEFFHKNHIDNNGLIPKGLANDATGLNIY